MALPSKGRIGAALAQHLFKIGLRYTNPSPRCYQNTFKGYPNVIVRLMPAEAVARSLIRGEVDFGLTGLDLVSELGFNSGVVNLEMCCNHALAQADVSVLVPSCWVDFNSLLDLRLLSLIKNVRVATKYVNLAKGFFELNQLAFLEVLRSEGVVELAPFTGKSDFIVDIVSTGATGRDNALKRLSGGVILSSSLCSFYNTSHSLSREIKELVQVLSSSTV
ncbi:MAG: ATP phosphoribosyltransferase [Candidatus Hodgkinia cicadicola]|nr:MAG: ATP phosphoribosyltransferase [Candidatus Hodgkinia cicadicola]